MQHRATQSVPLNLENFDHTSLSTSCSVNLDNNSNLGLNTNSSEFTEKNSNCSKELESDEGKDSIPLLNKLKAKSNRIPRIKKYFRLIRHCKIICAAAQIREMVLHDPRPHTQIKIGNQCVNALLDSGSTISILADGCFKLLEDEGIKYRKMPTIVHTADGTPNQVLGFVDLNIEYQGMSNKLRFYLVPSLKGQAYLGIDFWIKFQIAPNIVNSITISKSLEEKNNKHLLSGDQQIELNSILQLFPSFDRKGLGRTHILEHEIDVGSNKPVKQRYYAVSPIKQQQLWDEIDRMLKMDIIEESLSPWCSPVVIVPKPNNKIRMCLDLRKLNALTVKDAYPLPLIDGLLGRLQETNFISKIDLKEAFWQIPLAKASRPLTAFTVQGRPLYHFKVMPFGACNAPQTLCKLMHKIIPTALHDKIFVYLDDLLIVTATYQEHVNLLKLVAELLSKSGLTVNMEKSEFMLREVKYLGFLVGEKGLRVDPSKVDAIKDFPAPTSVKQTRRLLGMAGWYRRFIPNYSSVTSPISDLLSKPNQKKFHWTDEAQSAFENLKILLSSAPVLINPDYKRPFLIRCDASSSGVGGVLFQEEDDGAERPISFMSQKLNSAQRNYTVTELECLAAILSIKKFRQYIDGYRFTVITDHASLKWLMSQKDLSGRLARWSLKLQGYDFIIKHQKGSENVVPDALSRTQCDSINELLHCIPLFVETVDLNSTEFSDTEYVKIVKNVEVDPQKYLNLKVHENRLYIRLEPKQGDVLSDLSIWKLWIPKPLTNKLMEDEHNNVQASHGGIVKTLDRLRRYYYWPRMRQDVQKFVNSCETCKTTKATNQQLRPPLGSHHRIDRPFQKIYMDLLGPYPRSSNQKTTILIILDQLTKYVILKTLTKATATKVASILREEIFDVYGVPETVFTDNGVQFVGKEMKALLKEFGINHMTTAFYSPQANASERVNRSILAAIRAYIDKNKHTAWDAHISQIASALRTSVHQSTKYSPYFSVFGYHKIDHADSYKLLREIDSIDSNEIEIINTNDRLTLIHDQIRSNLRKAYEKFSHHYNLRSKLREFQPGQVVYVRQHPLSDAVKKYSAKFADKFAKGFIKSREGNVNYVVVDENDKIMGKFHTKDIIT